MDASKYKPLRIVILDHAFHSWRDPEVQRYFRELVSLKLEGYGANYKDGVLPVDATDYFGTHMLVCEEEADGSPTVIGGYKLVSLSRCERYKTPFPPLSLLKAANRLEDLKRVEELIEEQKRVGRDITYDSAWTMKPEIRNDRERNKFIRHLITVIATRMHQDPYPADWLTIGVLRFKTNEYFEYLGHEQITSPFGVVCSLNEPGVMMICRKPSPEAASEADQFGDYWANRISLGAERLPQEMPIAA